MNKLWYIHTMDYYLVIARNNLLLHRDLYKPQGHYAGLGEPVSKVIYCMTPFIYQSGKGKNIETENRSAVARGYGLGKICSISYLWWGLKEFRYVYELIKHTHIYIQQSEFYSCK